MQTTAFLCLLLAIIAITGLLSSQLDETGDTRIYWLKAVRLLLGLALLFHLMSLW